MLDVTCVCKAISASFNGLSPRSKCYFCPNHPYSMQLPSITDFLELSEPVDGGSPVRTFFTFSDVRLCTGSARSDEWDDLRTDKTSEWINVSKLDVGFSRRTSESPDTTTTCLSGVKSDVSSIMSLDYQMGKMVEKLARIRAPYASFGIFRDPPIPLSGREHTRPTPWSSLFQDLIYRLLQTANEKLLYLPTQSITEYVRASSQALDTFSIPRLCIIDLEPCDLRRIQSDRQTSSLLTRADSILADAPEVQVILEYKMALWGDLFFSRAFLDPSPQFLEGIGPAIRSMMDSQQTRKRLAL